MKRPNQLKLFAALLSLWFVLIACDPDTNIRLPLFEIETSNTLSGSVTGTANSLWTFPDQTIDCPDPAAEYTLNIAADSKLPADTHITGKIADNLRYFRLDATAVLRTLDNAQCFNRDPSDDRIHTVIEGSFDPFSSQFKALACSIFGEPSSSEIYYTSEFVVSGDITCTLSDQSKYAFHFAGLQLK